MAGPGGPGRALFGRPGTLAISPMPIWAMIAVIGWVVGWSVIGAWRTMTRDASHGPCPRNSAN